MKRKIILSTTITTIVIALVVFCFGVYAAMTQNFTITNSIGFVSAKNVLMTFRGEVGSCKQTVSDKLQDGYETKEEYLLDKGFKYEKVFKEEDRKTQNDTTSYTWDIKDAVQFINSATPITYKIEFYNYSEVKVSIKLSFTKTGQKIANAVSCTTSANSKLTTAQDSKIDDYLSEQEIVLEEYVVGQTQAPAKCVFLISTSMTSDALSNFSEANDFTFTAAAVE